jgi:predicted GNAT family acetyltransferase
VKDGGSVVLTAACTPPRNIVMYETRNAPSGDAVRVLAGELRGLNWAFPGVMAEAGLARRFAEAYGGGGFARHMSMNIMRLDAVNGLPPVPGRARPLREEDLCFAPYWAREFAIECVIEVFDLGTYMARQTARVAEGKHFIWEDKLPVSQAHHNRSTPNGAVVAGVYTPPWHRKRGYAGAVVAHLSRALLERGNKFCALFADAANPVSNGIYRKIGYKDVCVVEELRFDAPQGA